MPRVNPGRSRLAVVAFASAFVWPGCSMFREARVTLPVVMSPMADATLRAELARVLVSNNIALAGVNEYSSLVVVLRVTNAGREPYTLNTGSIACWLELSPDRPDETRALAPLGGGEGADPHGGTKLGSVTIRPGETREAWVRFRG